MAPIRKIAILLTLTAATAAPAALPGGPARAAPPGRVGPSLAPGYGTYQWPVVGPIVRGFEPPPDPYSAGHRGIDIGAPFGSAFVAAQDGTVAFAGWIGGSLFLSIDHADGVRTTYSWLSRTDVAKGAVVVQGQVVGLTGSGHPGSSTTHLHFGARVGNVYLDPMLLLEAGSLVDLIHLAPLGGPWDHPGIGSPRLWSADVPKRAP